MSSTKSNLNKFNIIRLEKECGEKKNTFKVLTFRMRLWEGKSYAKKRVMWKNYYNNLLL